MQSRPCGAWNITVHEYSAAAEEQHHVGAVLHTFCPRDTNKLLTLPWRLNTVVVRLAEFLIYIFKTSSNKINCNNIHLATKTKGVPEGGKFKKIKEIWR